MNGPAIRPKRIVLIDDDQDILFVTKMALEALGGFTIQACTSAKEGLESLRVFQPDLILVDVMMPDIDGLSLIRQLKHDPEFSSIPVLFMTARTQPNDLVTYGSLGAIGVISKPFDPEELVLRLNTFWDLNPECAPENALTQTLEQFHRDYRDRLPAKIREMEGLWRQICSAEGSRESLEDLHRFSHDLAGSGASYGFAALGARARSLETTLSPNLSDFTELARIGKDELSGILASLGEEARRLILP